MNTQNTELFQIPGPFADDTPFEEMHVWEWAKNQPRADVTSMNYLTSLGFVTGKDKLSTDDLKRMEYAIECFHRTAPYMAPRMFSELFTLNGEFWVRDRDGRFSPTDELKQALADAGWIYDVTPDTTFFEIIGDHLFAKYQQILGSRCICKLT